MDPCLRVLSRVKKKLVMNSRMSFGQAAFPFFLPGATTCLSVVNDFVGELLVLGFFSRSVMCIN